MARISAKEMEDLSKLLQITNIREADDKWKKRKVAVMNFGRLNPPHKGHLKLLQFISDRATLLGGEGFVFLSASKNYLPPNKGTKWRDPVKPVTKTTFYSLKSNENPLSVFEKVPILNKFPNISNIEFVNPQAEKGRPYTMDRAINHLRKLGYNEIHFVVGTDRFKQLKKKDVEKKWNVVLVEHPRAETLENDTLYSLGDNIPEKALKTNPQLISGKKVRAAAAEHEINIPGIKDMTGRQAKLKIYSNNRKPIKKRLGWYNFKNKMPDNISDKDLEYIIYKIKKGMLLDPRISYTNHYEKNKMVRRSSVTKKNKKGGRRKTRKRRGRGKTKKNQKIKKKNTTIKLKRPAWYKRLPPMEYTDKINEEFAKEAVYRLYKENPNLPTITKEDAKMLMSDEELAKNLQGVNFTGGVKYKGMKNNKGWATLKSKKGEKAKAIRKNRDLEMEVTRPLDTDKIFADQLKVRKLKDNIDNALLQYQDSENKLNKLNIKQLVKDKRPMWPRKLIQKRRNTRKLIKSNKENIKKAEEALKNHEDMMKDNDILTFGKGWGLNPSGQGNKYIKHKMFLKGKPLNGGRRTRKKRGSCKGLSCFKKKSSNSGRYAKTSPPPKKVETHYMASPQEIEEYEKAMLMEKEQRLEERKRLKTFIRIPSMNTLSKGKKRVEENLRAQSTSPTMDPGTMAHHDLPENYFAAIDKEIYGDKVISKEKVDGGRRTRKYRRRRKRGGTKKKKVKGIAKNDDKGLPKQPYIESDIDKYKFLPAFKDDRPAEVRPRIYVGGKRDKKRTRRKRRKKRKGKRTR